MAKFTPDPVPVYTEEWKKNPDAENLPAALSASGPVCAVSDDSLLDSLMSYESQQQYLVSRLYF